MAATRHFRSARRSLADDQGGVALTVAIALPVLMGAAGLAVDLGQWYRERATLQLAADAAAMGDEAPTPTVTFAPNNDPGSTVTVSARYAWSPVGTAGDFAAVTLSGSSTLVIEP